MLDILVIDERAGRERDQDVGLVKPTVVAGLPLELAPQGPEIVDEAGASKRVAIPVVREVVAVVLMANAWRRTAHSRRVG